MCVLLDRYMQLATNAHYGVFIFANPQNGKFTFEPRAEIERVPRGLKYCGFVGIVGGRPCTKLTEPLGNEAVDALAAAYVAYVAASLFPLRQGRIQ